MKPITAWAIVDDKGKIPNVSSLISTSKLLVVAATKKGAMTCKLKSDSVVKVSITAIDTAPMPPTKRKHKYCR